METARYRAFVAAVDTGSISQAAKELSYTPSGVSQLLSALERDLGFQVLERTKQGVSLTKNGQELINIAREIIYQENRLIQIAHGIKGLATGSVTIGSYPSIAAYWLPQVIKSFSSAYPAIKINIMEGVHQELETWLKEKIVDLAFMSNKNETYTQWIPLAQDPMVAVVPPNHPYAHEKSFPLEACATTPFIMPAYGQDVDVVNLLNKYHIEPDVAYSTIENNAMLAMIEAGLGMSIMNSLVTKKNNFDIVTIPIEPKESISLGIAVATGADTTPAVNCFIEFSENEIKQNF